MWRNQWPWTEADTQDGQQPLTHRRLIEDGQFFHENKRAKLIIDNISPMPEPPNDGYPFVLLSGRGTVSQWHTQTRTGKSPMLRKLYPKAPYIEIHPEDAAEIGVEHGEKVYVQSRRGEVIVAACLTPTVRRGQVFMPMHYEATNQLTLRHFDPYSRQPSYKDCAVRIVPAKATKV